MTQALPLKYFVSEGPLKSSIESQPIEKIEMSLHTPIQDAPILPIIPWGLRFDEDLMITLDDPTWGMIEVCKVNTPDGAVWFSLDSHQDGQQLVGIPESKLAKSFAQAFPASLYTNDLEVTEHKLEDGTHFDVSYRRADRKLIQFSIETEDEDKPPRKRNGNAMNHSANQSLAILDIFSLDLHSKTLEWPHQEQPVFSVLGKPVVARMRQSVGGIHNGQWEQIASVLHSHTGDTPLETIPTSNGLMVQTLSFPQLQYHFIEDEAQLRLQHIAVQQPHAERRSEVFRIDFVPPLPDLRYGSPQTPFQSDAFMSLNGQSVYSRANVHVEGIDTSTHILIEPTAPYWAAERPISIVHHPQDRGIESQARVLTHGTPQQHHFKLTSKDTFVPEHLLDTQLMIWNKNPHRVSALDVGPQSADLKGGTWANGKRAVDTVFVTQTTQDLPSNGLFYKIPQIALIQNRVASRPQLEGNIQVQLPITPKANEQMVPFIHGFHLDSGPFHVVEGMTLSGFSIEIQNIQQTSEGVLVDLHVEVPYGSVPDRKQDLDHYSAFIQIDLGMARNDSSEALQRKSMSELRSLPSTRSLKRLSPLPLPEPADSGLLQSWGFEVLDDGPHKGRYIRGLGISSQPNMNNDALIMTAKWSRETQYRIFKSIVH